MFRRPHVFRVLSALILLVFVAGLLLAVRPAAASLTATFTPSADTWVNTVYPTHTYGTWTYLKVDASPTYLSYIRFNVANTTGITSAKLRLYVLSSAPNGLTVKSVSSNSWSETGMTWSTQPAVGGTITSSSSAVTANTWVTLDVTSYVKTNGTFSMQLSTPSTTAFTMNSREATSNQPQLVVTYTGTTTSATATPTKSSTINPTVAPTAVSTQPVSTGTTFYVSTSGSDSNSGSLSSPWRNVQKCLNNVKPGQTCMIRGGTYNEALSIITSGTSTGPITLKNYSGETVTINSGTNLTLKTTGYQSYYVIDGLRLISSTAAGEGGKTIDLSAGTTNSTTATNGNSYFTMKNCYVEGTVLFYGTRNTVQNCEFNGRNVVADAIHYRFTASNNALVQGNRIHDYLRRAVWIDWTADNAMIRNNTVYNTQLGIDCDGANVPVTNCHVINNTIYNTGGGSSHTSWGCGVFLEDAWNAVVDGNRIYNSPAGNAIYVVNYGNGPSWYTKGNIEYRNNNSNIILRNNIMYGNGSSTILVYSANGVSMVNNTIQLSGAHAVDFYNATNTSFYPQNWTVRNNIITASSSLTAWWAANSVSFTSSRFSNDLYYNAKPATGESALSGNPLFVSSTDFHVQSGSPAIDHGYNAGSLVPTDFAGTARPQGAADDIGAYER